MYDLKLLSVALFCGIGLIAQPACLADESTTTIKSKETTSGAAGTTSKVEHTRVSSDGTATSHRYKAQVGPGGAKVSATKVRTGINPDGSVSKQKTHESHEVNALGSTHHKSASSTTVAPDGSSSTVKTESHKSSPE